MSPMMVIVQTAPGVLSTLVLLPRHHCVRLYLVHATPLGQLSLLPQWLHSCSQSTLVQSQYQQCRSSFQLVLVLLAHTEKGHQVDSRWCNNHQYMVLLTRVYPHSVLANIMKHFHEMCVCYSSFIQWSLPLSSPTIHSTIKKCLKICQCFQYYMLKRTWGITSSRIWQCITSWKICYLIHITAET